MLRYDLGGHGKAGDRVTVNLDGDSDVKEDIIDFVSRCGHGSVDEFFLSHTLEHVPAELYEGFLRTMADRLALGGCIRVIQTDADAVIRQYVRGDVCFRSMRSVLFTPPDRLAGGSHPNASALQLHRNMWSAKELARDLEAVGLWATIFDPPTWPFDMTDPFYPDELKRDWGKPIAQLGVTGVRQ